MKCQTQFSGEKKKYFKMSTEIITWYAKYFKIAVLEEKRKETENSFAEQLADMDRKVNEAKREHAKAGRI